MHLEACKASTHSCVIHFAEKKRFWHCANYLQLAAPAGSDTLIHVFDERTHIRLTLESL